MRIARILTRLNLGGPARQALAADPVLRERGHEVRLYCGRPEAGEGDLFDEFSARGLDVVRVPGLVRGIHPAQDLRASAFLRKELESFAPDVVHTHASKAGTLGRQVAFKQGRVAVHTFHGHVLEGYFPAALSRTLQAHERRLAARSARILAVSHATAEDLLRLEIVDEERLVVVPPGVELDRLLRLHERDGALRKLIGAQPADLVVGVIGRLAEVKQPHLALEVFDLLHERYADLHLCFIGDGAQRGRLERAILAGNEAMRARVHLVGARADMPPVFADLDAVLLTSRSEGLPVALIEAGAAGKAVVATPVGGVVELVAHERTGFLGADGAELAYGLSQLLDDGRLRKEMGARARLRVEKRHAPQALAQRLEEIYTVVYEETRCGS